MGRHFAANGMTLLIVVLLGALAAISWGRQQYTGPGPLAEATCFEVVPGSTMRRVAEKLAADGIISNASVFRIGANYSDRSDALKAGSFVVSKGASMDEILDIITQGGQSTCGTEVVFRVGVRNLRMQVREFDGTAGGYIERVAFTPGVDAVPEDFEAALEQSDIRYRVVMAEGVTTLDMVTALKTVEFLTGESGDLPSEGMLAPGSYEVRAGSERAALIETMRATQAARLDAAWADRAEDVPLESPEELLTLASIIEKETGVAEERGVVAAVFVNRLRRGMRLQTDPTIIYGITRGAGLLDRPIRRSDIDGVTEQNLYGAVTYNTYQIDGLPPGPIANPGAASIQAAANPEASDYLFFVADGSGGHAFAETLEEHNQNVAAFRALSTDQ